jgi:formamidopyrimidine-DNA glycosylase
MPELAEVEFHRKRWSPGLGQTVGRVSLHPDKRVLRGVRADELADRLAGSRLAESFAHGKQMLFRFAGGGWLGVHLGMTGELRTEPWDFTPGKHDHLVLHQARRSLVFADPRLFGRILFQAGEAAPEWWTSLPPGLLAPEFTVERVDGILRRRAKAPIKAVLLMQPFFPGIGNWMADEILWRIRVAPQTPAGQLAGTNAAALRREIQWVAAAALATIGETYADPPATWLFPHRWRDGGHCPRCGGRLGREEVGGRTTAWCPECQPGTARINGRTPKTRAVSASS